MLFVEKEPIWFSFKSPCYMLVRINDEYKCGFDVLDAKSLENIVWSLLVYCSSCECWFTLWWLSYGTGIIQQWLLLLVKIVDPCRESIRKEFVAENWLKNKGSSWKTENNVKETKLLLVDEMLVNFILSIMLIRCQYFAFPSAIWECRTDDTWGTTEIHI